MNVRQPVLALLILTLVSVGAAGAQTPIPQVRTQAPGFYRMMLGDVEITALNDGVVPWPASTVIGATKDQIRLGLAEMRLPDTVGMSYSGYLVNTGTHLVLIDTGTGGKLADMAGFKGAGRLLANLRAAGYRPDQVDVVCITHAGPDHVGGLTTGAEMTFPNAVVWAARREVETYVDSAKSAAAVAASSNQDQARGLIAFEHGLFAPYIAAGKFHAFDGDVDVVPGVRALATPGHTPGHTSYVVESRGQRMIVIGDLVHWAAIQFPYPAAYTAFDADSTASAASRLRVFRMAATDDDWVAGAHISFPGIGKVRADARRFYWIPVNYEIPK